MGQVTMSLQEYEEMRKEARDLISTVTLRKEYSGKLEINIGRKELAKIVEQRIAEYNEANGTNYKLDKSNDLNVSISSYSMSASEPSEPVVLLDDDTSPMEGGDF